MWTHFTAGEGQSLSCMLSNSSMWLRPNPHWRHVREFQNKSFDIACVQCGHPHSHQQVPFACVARVRPVWMRPKISGITCSVWDKSAGGCRKSARDFPNLQPAGLRAPTVISGFLSLLSSCLGCLPSSYSRRHLQLHHLYHQNWYAQTLTWYSGNRWKCERTRVFTCFAVFQCFIICGFINWRRSLPWLEDRTWREKNKLFFFKKKKEKWQILRWFVAHSLIRRQNMEKKWVFLKNEKRLHSNGKFWGHLLDTEQRNLDLKLWTLSGENVSGVLSETRQLKPWFFCSGPQMSQEIYPQKQSHLFDESGTSNIERLRLWSQTFKIFRWCKRKKKRKFGCLILWTRASIFQVFCWKQVKTKKIWLPDPHSLVASLFGLVSSEFMYHWWGFAFIIAVRRRRRTSTRSCLMSTPSASTSSWSWRDTAAPSPSPR